MPDQRRIRAHAHHAQLMLSLSFAFAFGLLAFRMVNLAMNAPEHAAMPMLASAGTPAPDTFTRPDIVDRNGRQLATDIRSWSLYANRVQVRESSDPDEAAEKIAGLFRDIDAPALASRLRTNKNAIEWIRRGLGAREASAAHNLGIPGLYIAPALTRYYPQGSAAAQILGVTNIDNRGDSGIEKYIDEKLGNYVKGGTLAERPIVKLSIDLGVQHALSEELSRAKEKYKALAAMGILLDVTNGEVLASASLPDFDPNRRVGAFEESGRNRVVMDNYELGSVFKTITIAMALDYSVVTRQDLFDTATPIRMGRYAFNDPHAKRGPVSVDHIFIHSSNTGAARIAMLAGVEKQKEFLKRLGLFDPIETEAGKSSNPEFPKVWRPVNAVTVSYGHGIAVAPLQFAAAAASLVNGGRRVRPTYLLSEGDARASEQIIRPQTSDAIREMMRLTVLEGTGRRAKVQGVAIGGKTGTALKLKNGRYSRDVINSFLAVFPIDRPKYLLLVTLDEPKPEKPGGMTEAAYNAAPTAGAIIGRVAPMLNVLPAPARFDEAAATAYENEASPQSGDSSSLRTSLDEPGRPRQRSPIAGRSGAFAHHHRNFGVD